MLDNDGSCLDIRWYGYDLVHVKKKLYFSSCFDDSSHAHSEEEEVEHTMIESC